MDAFAEPLNRLTRAAWFWTASTSARALHVTLGTELRTLGLRALAAREADADHRYAVVLLEDVFTEGEGGWPERAERLVQGHAERVAAYGEAGLPIGALALPAETYETPLGRFGATVRAYLETLRAPIEGLAVVLAPTRIEAPARWRAEVEALLAREELAAVRWALVEPDAPHLSDLVAKLGPIARACPCLVDEGQLSRELSAMSAARSAAGAEGPAAAGMAWPQGVDLPPRPMKPGLRAAPPEPTPEERYRHALSTHVLHAAAAARQGDIGLATTHQREARNLAAQQGDAPGLVAQELTLGGYALAAGELDAALARFENASGWAYEAELFVQVAIARLSAAMIHVVQQRPLVAMERYADGARWAEHAGETLLAIEGWRLAGQLAVELEREDEAIQAWSRAVLLAGQDPEAAGMSSMSELSRLLARTLRGRGLHEQASAIEASIEASTQAPPMPATALDAAAGGQ